MSKKPKKSTLDRLLDVRPGPLPENPDGVKAGSLGVYAVKKLLNMWKGKE